MSLTWQTGRSFGNHAKWTLITLRSSIREWPESINRGQCLIQPSRYDYLQETCWTITCQIIRVKGTWSAEGIMVRRNDGICDIALCTFTRWLNNFSPSQTSLSCPSECSSRDQHHIVHGLKLATWVKSSSVGAYVTLKNAIILVGLLSMRHGPENLVWCLSVTVSFFCPGNYLFMAWQLKSCTSMWYPTPSKMVQASLIYAGNDSAWPRSLVERRIVDKRRTRA